MRQSFHSVAPELWLPSDTAPFLQQSLLTTHTTQQLTPIAHYVEKLAPYGTDSRLILTANFKIM